MKIVGIDNGFNGGLVCIEDGRVIGKLTMPVIDLDTGKHAYDIPFIIQSFESWKPDLAILEKAQPYPKQGGVSNYSIGLGYGIMQGVLSTLKIPFEVVHPKTWQKSIFNGLPHEDTKAASALFCLRRWPTVDWRKTERCKKVHDGLTDAACLSEYGFRIRG